MWVWIAFNSSNESLISLFSEIKPVSHDFVLDERMAWVEVNGLPLGTWNKNCFQSGDSTMGKSCLRNQTIRKEDLSNLLNGIGASKVFQ
ncbi:hypothetical protein L1987_45524 [Smallanthus sonchifolius]|uniref:Uncharacterized protein n=1 Tax=Smallanthus sonchifolius TaxID=185202 RepID=A0ACB9FY79_9ASTR|nr:hypothetical protein L1987_45524 [Smallanthus sonchifolius]